jgi:phosphate:Na+ symporter
VMLGADVGSTIAVQVLSLRISALVPLLLSGGVAAFMLGRGPGIQNAGRIAIGLALIILSLGMVVAASEGLRGSDTLALVLARLGDDLILAFMIGVALAWLIHSSVATVLLVISLCAVGLVAVPVACAFVLGANVGSGLVPIGLSIRSAVPARRILVGNLIFRVVGAVAVLPVLEHGVDALALLDASPARLIANFHTAFNALLALAFLPITPFAARLLVKLWPDEPMGQAVRAVRHLEDAVIDEPDMAIGCATREALRLADVVEQMLRDAPQTFQQDDDRLRAEIKALDHVADQIYDEIKLYLTRLTRRQLNEAQSRQVFDLVMFTTNLEHVGDIVDKNILELAAKRQRLQVTFSPEGWAEIEDLHNRVVAQLRLAIQVFLNRNAGMARELVREKDRIRAAEREATKSHFRRLRDGTPASVETSALHLDILRDLKRINSHITSVALPILEASGELRATRLNAESDGEIEIAPRGAST